MDNDNIKSPDRWTYIHTSRSTHGQTCFIHTRLYSLAHLDLLPTIWRASDIIKFIKLVEFNQLPSNRQTLTINRPLPKKFQYFKITQLLHGIRKIGWPSYLHSSNTRPDPYIVKPALSVSDYILSRYSLMHLRHDVAQSFIQFFLFLEQAVGVFLVSLKLLETAAHAYILP